MEPIGSIWLTGFKVSRPAFFAVSSPNPSATAPWEISWMMTEKSKTAIWNRKMNIGSIVGNYTISCNFRTIMYDNAHEKLRDLRQGLKDGRTQDKTPRPLQPHQLYKKISEPPKDPYPGR